MKPSWPSSEVLNALWMLIDTEWNHVNLRGEDVRASFKLTACQTQAPMVGVPCKMSVASSKTFSVVSCRRIGGKPCISPVGASVVSRGAWQGFFSIEILIRFFGFKRWRFMFEDCFAPMITSAEERNVQPRFCKRAEL